MADHLKMHTKNIAAENFAKLAALFPNAVTETITGYDERGEAIIERAIDKDILMQEINCKVVEGREERYQFTWPDKKKAVLAANTPINKTLRPCREESVNFDSTENLYIEGDNLEVLKLLQETYLGKVKLIYIDPPYNTGNDFVYNDDFRVESGEWRAESGNYDADGNLLVDNYTRNTESNGRFHTDWLNMIYPRLKLARDLLSDDGVIFISIDDNEVENLKKICNEIFGESNFITDIIWEKRYTRNNDAKLMSTVVEHILFYRKSDRLFKLREPRTEKQNSTYSNPDNDPRGVWTSVLFTSQRTKEERPNLSYAIENPITGELIEHPTNAWKYSKQQYEQLVADNRLYWGKDGNNTYPRLKRFLSELEEGIVPINLWYYKETATLDEGTKLVDSILGKDVFDYPKPIQLIIRMLKLMDGNDFTILDFFSGSATTAHAVMKLNSEDNGNRKFIMVQLPEVCGEKSEAYKAGYKNICEIGKARIRRVGKQIRDKRMEIGDKRGEDGDYRGESCDNSVNSNLSSIVSTRNIGEERGEIGEERLEIIERRKEGKNGKSVSGIDSLAKGDGYGGNGLFASEETSERGNVRAVGPDEAGGGVDSVEHSGGAGTQLNEGTDTVSVDSSRLKGGARNTTSPVRENRLSGATGNRASNGHSDRNQQDAVSNESQNLSSVGTIGKRMEIGDKRGEDGDYRGESCDNSVNSNLSSIVSNLDVGFRVLKLDSSNMEDVYYSPEDLAGQDLFKSNIKSERTAEDLLFQVMLDLGIMLSSRIDTKQIDGKTVYYVAGNYLAACFDENVTEETIAKIAKEKPYYFVMKDSSMANDSVATNFEQIFATYSPETIRRVL